MYGSLDISTSGMIAQRIRVEAAAANMVNKDSVSMVGGRPEPYRARHVMLSSGDPTAITAEGKQFGVHVADIALSEAPPNYKYDPESPFAMKDGPRPGYVPFPNINPMIEQINGMEAARAYEANVVAAETTKTMMAQALRLIA